MPIDFALPSNVTQSWLIMFVLDFTWQPFVPSSSNVSTQIMAVLTQDDVNRDLNTRA